MVLSERKYSEGMKKMPQIRDNLKATTLQVWYDLVTSGCSTDEGIKNEATTQTQRTRRAVQQGNEVNLALLAGIFGG